MPQWRREPRPQPNASARAPSRAAGARTHQVVRRQRRAPRRRSRGAPRPGAGPRRRERRRQVDADEDPRRRPPARRGHDRDRRRSGRPSATRSRPSSAACRPSSRSSTCSPSARSPRTSGSAASRVGAAWSTPRAMNRDTDELLAGLGITGLRATRRVRSLSVAEQQIVEIAKAVSFDSRIIQMDEPTAALADHEVELLYRIIGTPHRARRRDHLRLAPPQGDLRPLRHDHRAQGRRAGRHRAPPHDLDEGRPRPADGRALRCRPSSPTRCPTPSSASRGSSCAAPATATSTAST